MKSLEDQVRSLQVQMAFTQVRLNRVVNALPEE